MDNSTEILTATQISIIVLESIIGFISVIGNGFILLVFAREERLRKKRNFYLMSLAVSDFLMAILGIPTTVMTYLGLPKHPGLCLWSLCILDTTRLLAIYSVVAISIDRLKAVLKPVAYRNDTSNSSTLFNIFYFWGFAFMMGFLPLFGWNQGDEGKFCIFPVKIGTDYLNFFTIIGIIIPLIIIVIAYSFIIAVIRRITSSERRASSSNERKSAQSREVTATIRISIIVATYVICELPISTVNILNATSPTGLVTNVNLVHLFLALAHVHSAINPFLYAFNVKEFKDACKKVWRYGEHDVSSAVRSSSS